MGKLYNPDVRYSFNIPIEDKPQQFFWDAYGPWQECSSLCQGEGGGRIRAWRRVWSGDELCGGNEVEGGGEGRVRGAGAERGLSG